jgi:dephospho-CoA kinase
LPRASANAEVAKLRVGLTGGIGSGKSAVAEIFAARGATVIDADVLARAVVERGSEALGEIADTWPEAIAVDGTLDRPALARIVFGDDAARARLNAITHPRVRARAAELERAAPDGLVVQVIPLLFEGESWRDFDRTVVVVAPDDVRIARVVARDRTEREAVERRMAAQIDPALARGRADYVIENDGDLDALRVRSGRVYDELARELRAKEGPQ